MSDKIISLFGGTRTFELKASCRDSKIKRYCKSHCKNVVVDTDQRIVECAECGRVLDAFDYLASWANATDSRLCYLKAMDVEKLQRAAEVEVLKKEVAKLKRKVREADPTNPILRLPFGLADAVEKSRP